MGGEKDRRAATGHLAQDILDQAGGLGVQPDGGLIQHQYFGVVHQGGSQRGLLLHAVAVRVDGVVAGLGQVEQAQQLVDPPRHLGFLQLVQVADESQQLAAGELGVQVGGIGDEAAGGLGLQRLGLHIVARHAHAARGGLEQADDHLDRSCLSGAVGAEEAEHLPAAHREADVVHRQLLAVALDQVLGFDEGCS